MNIYIYGSQSFKKEIHQTLEHSNIRFKLDDNTLIKDIVNINELKEIIKNNPNDIYLIDDSKIIKKNSLNKKLKFLAPKDGIDEEFLLDSGIADLSIDSLSEIPKYILKKYEEEKLNEPEEIIEEPIHEVEEENKIELDDELSSLLVKEEIPDRNKEENLEDAFGIQQDVNLDSLENLIGSINEDEEPEAKDVENLNDIFGDNFGLNNSSLDYDDDNTLNQEEEDFFSSFLVENENSNDMEEFDESSTVEEEFEDVDFFNEILSKSEKKKEEKAESSDIIDDINLMEDFNFENSLEKEEDIFVQNSHNEVENKTLTYEQPKGDRMIDEDFSELDSLNEKDLLEALSGIGAGATTNSSLKEEKNSYQDVAKQTSSIEISSGTNTNDLAQLLSKLLNNKTLEITIKIKD